MTHSAPTDHRPSLGMTQLIKLNRESVCDSKNFKTQRRNCKKREPIRSRGGQNLIQIDPDKEMILIISDVSIITS